MHKQKTVAKWIAAVLLITVAIGGYVLFSAFYGAAANPGGEANAGTSGSDGDKPPLHIPYYTTLPRESENFNGVKIGHAGGENDDAFLDSVTVGSKTYCFFESESKEYDLRENGLHLAVTENNRLTKIVRFAGDEEKLLDVKFSLNGITAVTAGSDKNTLYLFSSDGNVIGEKEMPKEDECAFYLNGKTLMLFAADENRLTAYEISNGLNAVKSEFDIALRGAKIKSVLTTKTGFAITADSANGSVYLLEFDAKSGFKILKQYINSVYVQFGCGTYEQQLTYFLLLQSDGKYVLHSLNAAFAAISKAEFQNEDGSRGAAFFVYPDSVRVVFDGYVFRFCRHLDLLEKTPAEYRDGSFTRVNAGTDNYFSTLKDGLATLYVLRPDFTAKEIFSEAGVSGEFKITTATGRVFVGYTSSANTGKAQMNFGGSDVFTAEIPLPEM